MVYIVNKKLYVLSEIYNVVIGVYDSKEKCKLARQEEIKKDKLEVLNKQIKPITNLELHNRQTQYIEDYYFIKEIEVNKLYVDGI